MNRPDVKRLLSALNVKRISVSDEWVNSSCPLASVGHTDGIDRHPSFGITINPKGESVYRCFTCSDSAPLSGLIHNLWLCNIQGWQEAMEIYGDSEKFSDREEEKTETITSYGQEFKKVKEPIPDRVLELFPLLKESTGYEAKRCFEYLNDVRLISKETQDLFELRHHINDRVILFPRIDRNGKIWWMRARSRMSKVFFSISPSYFKESNIWGDSSHLFGEQFLTTDPVIIVESETDVLRLHTLGIYNVVGTGGNVQKAQLDRLFHTIVLLGFDADVPGLRNKVRAEKQLRGYATLFYLDWRKAGVRDAGELKSKADFDKVYNGKLLL